MDQVTQIITPHFGCDPEIFLLKGGQVVGAEKVIPEEGLTTMTHDPSTLACTVPRKGGIVLDGVQVELNPAPSYCRALLANEISAAFKTLKAHLAKTDGFTASFSQIVEVDPSELDSLSDKAKALGCAPSNNIYDSGAKIGVNPATYTKRSAGGHIHIGLPDHLKPHRERLVPLLDIFVGNTSVLMDRHPGNAERRKVYGRAGEHRLPAHGLEYRTLSNFWLRGYPLFSGVLGITRFVVNVLAHTVMGEIYKGDSRYYATAEHDILQLVDVEAVCRAINTNDVELAKRNYLIVREYLTKHAKAYATGLHTKNLLAFDHFVSKIDTDGIEYWFPDDPMEHWTTKYGTAHPNRGMDGHDLGWETFLYQVEMERRGVVKHV